MPFLSVYSNIRIYMGASEACFVPLHVFGNCDSKSNHLQNEYLVCPRVVRNSNLSCLKQYSIRATKPGY